MEKVIFILAPSFSSSDWLNKKMHRITSASLEYLSNDAYPVYEIDQYSELDQYINFAEFLVVATAGNVFIDKDHLNKKINSIPDDVGLITHLMQMPEDSTTWMHEQFFIIRTSAIKSIDLSVSNSVGPQLVRSEQSIHGDHTPAEVTLGDVTERAMKFGSKLIEHVLSNGYRVINFDNDWRYSKVGGLFNDQLMPSRGYLYPTKSTEQFETALKTMSKVDGLDDSQQQFFGLLDQVLKQDWVNVHSYEVPPQRPYVDTVIVPAIGMLGELTAYYTYAERIIFYDINPNNIAFKKHLYENWDGKDYDSFAAEYCKQHNLNIEPSLESDIELANSYKEQIERYVYSNWNEFKQFEVEFVCTDIVKNIDQILSYVEESPTNSPTTLIHTSTILQDKYMISAILYSDEEIEATKNKIKNKKNLFWYEPGLKY